MGHEAHKFFMNRETGVVADESGKSPDWNSLKQMRDLLINQRFEASKELYEQKHNFYQDGHKDKCEVPQTMKVKLDAVALDAGYYGSNRAAKLDAQRLKLCQKGHADKRIKTVARKRMKMKVDEVGLLGGGTATVQSTSEVKES